MRLIITIILLLSLVIKVYSQAEIECGDSGQEFVDKINGNFDSIPDLIYGREVAQLWNDMSTASRLAAYSNDSLRNRRFTLAFTSDIHNYWSGEDRLYNFIQDYGFSDKVDAFIMNGDLTKYWSEQITKTEFVSRMDSVYYRIDSYDLPILLSLGNHESNSELTGDTTYAFFKSEQRSWYIDSMIYKQPTLTFHTNDAADSDGCYYYIDYDDYKIRIIVLDWYDSPQTHTDGIFDYPQQTSAMLSGDQLEWLGDSALNIVDSTWHVIVMGHQSVYAIDNSELSMTSILGAFIDNTTTGTLTGSESYNPYSLSFDFSSINNFDGSLVAYLYGHGHESIQSFSTYWQIEIPSMRPNSYMTTRIIGTSSEDAADFVIVDKNQRLTRFIRYGAGAPNWEAQSDFNNIHGDRGLDNSITY